MSSSSIIDIYFQLGAKKSEREIPIREKLALVAAKNLFDDDDYIVMVTVMVMMMNVMVFCEFSMVVISCYVEMKVWWFGLVFSEET